MGLTGLHDSLVHGLVSSSFVILCSLEDIFEWKPLLGASIKILLSNGFCSVRLGQIWTHTTVCYFSSKEIVRLDEIFLISWY